MIRASRGTRVEAIHVAVAMVLLPALVQLAFGQQAGELKSGRISVVIVGEDTGQPVEASVRLLGGSGPRVYNVDDNGAFEIAAPAGSYLITAIAAGYVMGAAGQRTETDSPTLVRVVSGETRFVEIRLRPLGRIAGTVLDRDGRAAAGIEVHALREPTWGCTSTTGAALPPGKCHVAAKAITDASGRFQMSGLRTGSYHMMATSPRSPGAAISIGAPRGTTTYFPGTLFPDQATPISVTPGTQAEATFALSEGSVSRIAGTIVDASGRPPRNSVVIALPRGPQTFSLVPIHAELGPDGRFVLPAVPPGEYLIAVRDSTKFVRIAQAGGSIGEPFTGELADVRVRVPSDDLENLHIITRAGFELAGSVTRNGRPVRDLGRMSIAVAPGGDIAGSAISGGVVAVDGDGTFVLRNLVGPQRVIASPPAGLMVQRIVAGGVDVTDDGIDMSGAANIEVVLGPVTTVTGRVTTRLGVSVPGMSVIAFSQDPRLWTMRDTRHVRSVLAGLDGRFSIDGLPAGSYYVAAVPSTTEDRATEIDRLDPLVPRAARVLLRDGASTSTTISID